MKTTPKPTGPGARPLAKLAGWPRPTRPSRVSPTVEIFPRFGRKTAKKWEYLDSERVQSHLRSAVARWSRPHSGKGFRPSPPESPPAAAPQGSRPLAHARMSASRPQTRSRSASHTTGVGLNGPSPVTLTVEIFPQNRPKWPLLWEYLDSERIQNLRTQAG